MYQILLTTNDGNGKTFAANVPEKDVRFMQERLYTLGGFLRFNIDVYDVKVSAKEYEGYGKFQSKQKMQEWLYENVFKHDCKDAADFTEQYRIMMERFYEKKRIDDMATDILYDEFFTGKDTGSVWRKIQGYVACTMADYNCTHPTKERLRSFIGSAMCEFILEH